MNRAGDESVCYETEAVYTFTTKNKQKYIVLCQLHENSFYAVKFYLKNHSDSDNKYNILTNTGEAPRIFNTILDIMQFLYVKNPYSSFGVIGASLLTEKSKINSKRFQIYSKIFAAFFSPLHFAHYTCVNSSSYLLINRLNSTEGLKEKVEKEILSCYAGIFRFE